jgi:hydroxyacylglutathione hydrolase
VKIHQFIDEGLAHFSYAIVSNEEMALVDPARDPRQYYEFAEKEGARITAIFETHPHADFVSSHTEIANTTGASIYASRLVYGAYQYTSFDDGDQLQLGEVTLRAINTPGHSPDSICITAEINGWYKAVFTGDTLLIGDVGRPDLRENGRERLTDRKVLARAMYYSIHDRLLRLPSDVKVYPAHGGGSLCSRSEVTATFSTIGQEILTNPALRKMEEQEFVDFLLQDQPYVPKYFLKDVFLNKKGAKEFVTSIESIPYLNSASEIAPNALLIDTRPKREFDKGHIKGAINLSNAIKFETWLGSIVAPLENFYLIASNNDSARQTLEKIAKIGYENQVKAILVGQHSAYLPSPILSLENFKINPDKYTVVDARLESEAKRLPVFEHSLNIPLQEIRERWQEIPLEKPIVVHCAAGYRSAAASSILRNFIRSVPVFDLGEDIRMFTSWNEAA